jgi:hypothetical protein
MTKSKKILIAVIVGFAVGGFALAKYLTRNIRNYKYYKVTINDTEEPILSSEDVK